VHIVAGPEDASFHALRVTDPIFQELLLPADQEVTCGVHRTRSGITTVIQLRRRLVGGFTGWAEVIDDPEVESLCHRVSESLGFAGSINIQLRRTASGPRIFEINPRFSSTAVMRHRMGFQDVVWSINDMLGREVTPTRVSPGLRAVRLQNASVL
jgi:carbamoyl-phosphate synthase large subunit